ncbi:unnamed protein product [Penicillium salamii]|uniref:C2H2-type domain-containing protein n=1 Tax=Penicillium salamii TaxID=1612424 RepID=A0A9W4INQ0_9EURO|nr:unnamed protein product [Penicillium salamii]CAG8136929.1 unnamed protein product [Penicillium salamii]CAG8255445.1 unnamed protein product [Penicillium salamii]CAG8309601.1 unnamed protein product [Penicillium salamii]CAG8317260.1 unnamed protein product [Penicillium salamii]
MDYSQRSTRSAISPQPEDAHTHSSLAYSSPTSSPESHGRAPVGLGISGCGIEHAFDEVRVFNVPSQVPSQLVSPTPDFGLSYSEYTNESCYTPVYDQLQILSAGSLGLYSSASMSASPSYNSALEVGAGQDSFATGMSELWMHTPCSDPTTPSDAVTPPANLQWIQGAVPNAAISIPMPVTPRSSTNAPLRSMELGAGRSSIADVNAWQDEIPHEVATSNIVTPEPTPQPTKRGHGSPGRLISASGRQCPTCSKVFTRRSNCKEHQKMHNPDWKHNHPCEECRKSFGRSSDLKRHKDTVSPAIRVNQNQSLTWGLGPPWDSQIFL